MSAPLLPPDMPKFTRQCFSRYVASLQRSGLVLDEAVAHRFRAMTFSASSDVMHVLRALATTRPALASPLRLPAMTGALRLRLAQWARVLRKRGVRFSPLVAEAFDDLTFDLADMGTVLRALAACETKAAIVCSGAAEVPFWLASDTFDCLIPGPTRDLLAWSRRHGLGWPLSSEGQRLYLDMVHVFTHGAM